MKEAVLGAIAEFRKDTYDRLDQSHQKLATRQDDIIIGVVKDVGTVSVNKHLSDQTTAFIQ